MEFSVIAFDRSGEIITNMSIDDIVSDLPAIKNRASKYGADALDVNILDNNKIAKPFAYYLALYFHSMNDVEFYTWIVTQRDKFEDHLRTNQFYAREKKDN